MKCRHCQSENMGPFLDLGTAPPSNSYVRQADLGKPELWYPLVIRVCNECLLVQTEDFASRETFFSESYAYFSSFSTSWLGHAEAYVAAMAERFGLNAASRVVEIAANDGYLLQYVKERGIACLGVEPTTSTATAARAKGIEIVEDFFGVELAGRLAENGWSADLMAANNVLAHVPDINDFVSGFARLLKPTGIATFEFPHLLNMVEQAQFDTAYHEHYSYLSLIAVERIFSANGLRVFDVETTPWHGGSLRVFADRADTASHAVSANVAAMLAQETVAGMREQAFYAGFQATAQRVRNDFLSFLIDCQRQGLKVAAYGAAAKGNTLLNFAGVKPDLLSFVVDKNPAKQGTFLPGSRVPIVSEDVLKSEKPERVVILPWNLQTEIKQQFSSISDWGGKFVTAVPRLVVHP
ncbi:MULTISPECIES: class I SAM-dependent methyltransferase [Alphaproteobacteria]|uniref:SAM-dependent methyltransferase n=2 Tax=Alphaproteobacteria TaxID=28211 RepID=A0A512HDG5_9HYPH|nr:MULTISPECIES: class I SAM-dependent methyltransferase [Alphaproteobacteria]GEO83497.1 SAM-dependent methyltransferase [Ciceribacter naphthalenivorans]GLR24352.1 SAM-dependent methyltransferase [Ciceribacter naphthalenivorans]GLT07208.1 SAM-dependent methyltransferase [Sphingomonas psychrolutea]